MTVSIIIPTFQGAQRILATLSALEDQIYNDFEVIVAIDGSTDGTEEVLMKKEFQLNELKILSTYNRGRAGIRNYGASIAKGELLVFFDDDMRPVNDSLIRHVKFHSKHKESIYAGNPVEDPAFSNSDFHQYRCFLRKSWLSKYKNDLNRLTATNIYLAAANFSISKELFDKLGGFDSPLTDAEDHDFAIRAYEKGINIFFDKSNIAYHDDVTTARSYIRRRRQYQQARQILATKYSKGSYFRLIGWKRMIYSFFSLSIWVDFIDRSKLTFLPAKLRYKLYTLVVWGLGHYFPDRKI